MRRLAAALLLSLLVAGCQAPQSDRAPSAENRQTTTMQPEATSAEPRGLAVEELDSGTRGLEGPRIILAPSAAALSRETGLALPDAGEGTYLAAYWGEKPTGGYSVGVESARLEGGEVTVRLSLEEPAPDAIVTQALTYPYAAAVIRGIDPGEVLFVFEDGDGQRLGWPTRRASG
jgi:pyruvate/2-oxoglutarate dehydrogenase complex dihydrolipoamide acyltransferase (E2) component